MTHFFIPSFYNSGKNKNFNLLSFSSVSIVLTLLVILIGCSPSKKFTSVEDHNNIPGSDEVVNVIPGLTTEISASSGPLLRVLLNEYPLPKSLMLQSDAEIYLNETKTAVVKKGNRIVLSISNNDISLEINQKNFTAKHFSIIPLPDDPIIKIDGRKFRGILKIINASGRINIINQISLEDYVKGVMTKEMPLGKGKENYEALKAFSIIVRTYAFTKLFEKKLNFDIHTDTRDQVYGGVDGESEYSNKIVDETNSQILTYQNEPAIIFYHSTCGGKTEDAINVFTNANVEYLKSITDGIPSNCEISPRYKWTEIIPEYQVVNRLFKSGYTSDANNSIKNISVNSRFESGRVNELEFILSSKNGQNSTVKLYGNAIRSVIRSADDKSILRSNNFEILKTKENLVTINGKGAGHGVGMCQWGAIGLSIRGTNYKDILNFYFPGTNIKTLNDQ